MYSTKEIEVMKKQADEISHDTHIKTAYDLHLEAFCTDNDIAKVMEHYHACEWCKVYVEQRDEISRNSVSEVGWWSGYRDPEI